MNCRWIWSDMQIELITIKDSLFNRDVTATHVIRSLSSQLSHYMEQISARVRILRRIRDQTESAHWTGTTPKSTNAASLATAVPPRTMRDPPSNETVRASSTAPTMWNPEPLRKRTGHGLLPRIWKGNFSPSTFSCACRRKSCRQGIQKFMA